MKLKRNQWVCDHCGEVIRQASDGVLQWNPVDHDGERAGEIRIVHQNLCAWRGDSEMAGRYPYRCDHHLEVFLKNQLDHELHGATGLIRLTWLLSGAQAPDAAALAEVIRRLHVPGYEQARLDARESER